MTDRARRPTPADPMPGVVSETEVPSAVVRDLPPELGPDAVAVVEGRSFMISDATGDIPQGSIGGLVHDDTRFLSRWELRIADKPLLLLSSGTVEDYSAAFFLTNADIDGIPSSSIGVRRQRFISDGMHERVELENFTNEPISFDLRLSAGTDFADLFEIKECISDRSETITRRHGSDGTYLDFSYTNGTFRASTRVQAVPPADRTEGDELIWRVDLEPDQAWRCELTIPLEFGPLQVAPKHRRFGEAFDSDRDDAISTWSRECPTWRLESELLRDVMEKSKSDLGALRIEKSAGGVPIILPAAGLPWFLTIFGRDSLISAYQTMAFGPTLARGTLLALATAQGRHFDDFRDEEPGKILHEIRSGELTQLKQKPHDPYYGTADATQLWLILLSEYWRWTHDDEFVLGFRENIDAALYWMDHYGDPDGDGYIEYATRSSQGLGNQCWRDSWDGIKFADGSIPVLPIATCEIQGYTYDARRRVAELADGPLRNPELAQRQRAQAAELYERFNRDFWIDERGGYYAVGLDGDKRKIDSMTSNMGQLLWSGIVTPGRAIILANQLMSEAMFSGWGIRTTSSQDRGFNPIGYHSGTVWPHDNSLIAAGLARYGFRQEANRIIMAMMEAAKYSGYRLPEAFSGYDRSYGRLPVPYPTACSPQAWSAAAPMLFVRTMLGLDVHDGRLVADPQVPVEYGRIALEGLTALGKQWNVEAAGSEASVQAMT
ncbi:glycogen debranching enzyme [Micromonospora pisi]|uniref:Glycogen debranching enzyme n=1 Tax=Micromonospora pisi TaxID=589240 RepID=A0A495JP04_9ACTN|nr:glycogen debranching N-terminal domain-containing protein [Micromonospora pisi]RKR90571.1 glycogen debranching enzyme [Micromonospora pisi]